MSKRDRELTVAYGVLHGAKSNIRSVHELLHKLNTGPGVFILLEDASTMIDEAQAEIEEERRIGRPSV